VYSVLYKGFTNKTLVTLIDRAFDGRVQFRKAIPSPSSEWLSKHPSSSALDSKIAHAFGLIAQNSSDSDAGIPGSCSCDGCNHVKN
jgi:hypothetical protein